MPIVVEPMLASNGVLPSNENFAFEFKWDGIRAVVFLDRGRLRIQSRSLRDMTAEYPELQKLSDAARRRRLILDGELICADADGRPDFELIQSRIGRGRPHAIQQRMQAAPATLMIFDVLHIDGRSLVAEPYYLRRRCLADLGLRGSCWQTPIGSIGDGHAMLAAAREHRLEGVLCKRLDSVYRAGRSRDWIKVKNHQTETFTIGGWIVNGAGCTEALLVGTPSAAGGLEFVSRVELGKFGKLMPVLQRLRTERSPFGFALKCRRARYVSPLLRGEFRYLYRTASGWLREGCFLGLTAH